MKITDTHTHLYMDEFQHDVESIINKCQCKGIHRFFLPSINSNSILKIIQFDKKYPNICYPMIGLHPNYVNDKNLDQELSNIQNYMKKYRFLSVGEIGLDFHVSRKFEMEQKYVFQQQLTWANQMDLPVIIHSRNSFETILNILIQGNHIPLKGVFHCFNGNLEQALKIIKIGMKLGIGGIITFKNNKIVHFLKKIDLNHILLETDSPYLSPHPLRGKRNDPGNIRIILKKLSEIYSLSEDKVAYIIENNVNHLFFPRKKIKPF
ncbi:TatD family hydrolase [Blattabacterium cuenoti]|uniref:TatD family hydrolase n=1 Tax=Blattabacterium cuenoti TaxID=1653831 RepID=UPI00163D1C01|nr:TatD family hydrolase [Blattabacterium cuenoti]